MGEITSRPIDRVRARGIENVAQCICFFFLEGECCRARVFGGNYITGPAARECRGGTRSCLNLDGVRDFGSIVKRMVYF